MCSVHQCMQGFIMGGEEEFQMEYGVCNLKDREGFFVVSCDM